jgi:hypothetical protein
MLKPNLHNLLTTVVMLCGIQFAVAADSTTKRLIKCWHDNKGLRECGSTVPPEFSRNRIEFINEQGVVVQVVEATRTKEEQEREKERTRQQREKEAKIAEQKRRDEVLLSSYTSERDITTARDNNILGINSIIDITRSNLEYHQNSLDALNKQAGDLERNGTQPPQKLIEQINQAKAVIAEKQTSLKLKETDKAVMIKRYEDDIKRFRELTRKGLFN